MDACVVSHAKDCVIEVEEISLALKCKFVKCAQQVESEHRMRTRSRCREPLFVENLSLFVEGVVAFNTVTIGNVDQMGT